MNKLPVAPIQDEKGILHFNQEGRSYTINVNSKEERERVKNEINANSLTEYEWFKEKRGKKHWVLYNTEIYEIIGISNKYLHYKELCSIVPTIPINATSCRYMFHDCSKLTQLNLSIFNTSRITDMFGMFSDCTKLTKLDLSNFNTSNVINMSFMFDNCKALAQLDLSNFNTSKVTKTSYMFYDCSNLTQLNLSSFDTSHVIDMSWMFYNCQHLTLQILTQVWSLICLECLPNAQILHYSILKTSILPKLLVLDICSTIVNRSRLFTFLINGRLIR